MNKPVGNRQGLGYVQTDNNIASTSKSTFVLATKKPRNVDDLEGVLEQRPTRQHRTN